jgi:hypothetical protein
MDQDRQHTEQFTDEEVALRRHARFGQLPARVVPDDFAYLTRCADDLIETRQTDPLHEEPQEPVYRREWLPGYLERHLVEPRAGREEGRDVREESVRDVGRRERGEIFDRVVVEAGVDPDKRIADLEAQVAAPRTAREMRDGRKRPTPPVEGQTDEASGPVASATQLAFWVVEELIRLAQTGSRCKLSRA